MSLMSLAAAGIGAGMSYYDTWNQTVGPFARGSQKLQIHGLQKALALQNMYQKRYDTWKADFDYDYAQKYAQNSARWQVKGLEKADLNPILAVNGGSMAGTFGQPVSGTVNASAPHSARSKADISLAASQMAATARQNALLDEQIENVQAQTKEIQQRTKNSKETNGLTGNAGALSVLAHKLGLVDDSDNSARSRKPLVQVEKVANSARQTKLTENKFESTMRDLGQWLRSGGPFGNARTRREIVDRDRDAYWRRQF